MKRFTIIISVLLLLAVTACDPTIYDEGKLLPDFNEVEQPSGDNSYDVTAKPELVKATEAASPTAITVSWKAVKGALNYNIERRTDTSSWLLVGTVNSTSTSYVDSSTNVLAKYPITAGVDYTYRVRAVFPSGAMGEYSSEVTGRLLSAPAQVNASKGDRDIDGIQVTWSHIQGITTYQVWMMPNDDNYRMAKVGELKAVLSDEDCEFTYQINSSINSDKIGKEYRFAVVAVNASGVTSGSPDDAEYTVGYSFNQSAPAKVTNLTAEKGARPDGIMITWDDQPGVASDYIIYRAENGGAEAKIYKIRNSQNLTYNSDGTVSYLDDDSQLSDNIEYTYSVVATATRDDESGATVTLMGPAESTVGYLLSAPKHVELASIIHDPADGYGFALRMTAPIGLENSADISLNGNWTFNVYAWNSSEHPEISGTNYSDASSLIQRRTLFNRIKGIVSSPVASVRAGDVLASGSALVNVYYGDEGYDSFAVTSVNENGRESLFTVSNVEWHGPEMASGGIISNTYSSDYTANANGVLPIQILFSFNDYGMDYITSFVIKDVSETVLYETPSGFNETEGIDVLYNDDSLVPGQTTDMTVTITDVFGLSKTYSYSGVYGGLIPTKYIAVFESVVLKPWENTTYIPVDRIDSWTKSDGSNYAILNKINLGNSGSTQASGDADGYDSFRGGNVHYNCGIRLNPMGADITFTYTNFGESSYMYGSGAYSMSVNVSGTGSANFVGNGFTIYGNYPGQIGKGSISVESKAFVGSYAVNIQYSNTTWSGSVEANQK